MRNNISHLTVPFFVALLATSIGGVQALAADTTPLTLAEAIERVQAISPQRRAAQARAQAATGALHQASRFLNPSIDIRQENLGEGHRAPIDQTIDVFAVVSQPIELGGKRAARTAVAAADVTGAQAAIRQAERNLTLEPSASISPPCKRTSGHSFC